jgi:LysR family transcriptional regulator, glycine cleavage system transcriptional activator
MKEVVVSACSRELRKKHRIGKPVDLARVPLIHLVSRPDAWERWFRPLGVVFNDLQGMLVDQFAVATQAAIAGMGVALLPAFLIEAELDRGDLVLAVDRPVESEEGYYLAWPAARGTYPPLQAFRAWIQHEASMA